MQLIENIRIERHTLILIAILILGLFLRLYCLTCESLWLDEGYSVTWAKQEPSEMIEAVSRDVHPPLYFLILHYWIALFGDAEFTIRLLSVIFGFIAIFMMCRVGSLIFDRNVGLLSSLILSLSVFHIHYSQEIRGYSLMVLLALFSMYFFIRLFQERKNSMSVLYILSSTLLLYTHFFGLLVIAAQNTYLILEFMLSRKRPSLGFVRWLLLQAILFVLFLPWLGFLVRQMQIVQSGAFLGWLPVPTIISLITTLFVYSAYFSESAPLWVLASSTLLVLVYLILSTNSLLVFKAFGLRPRRLDSGNTLLLVWLLTPIVLPFIVSQFLAPIYWTRFTMPASIALYILIARGIVNTSTMGIRLSIISLVIALSLVGAWGFYNTTDNEQWRGVVGYIETYGGQNDLVLINAWYCHIPFDYYFRQDIIDRDVFPKWDMEVDKDNIKTLELAVHGYERVWIVLSHDGDPEGLIAKTLNDDLSYSLSYQKSYIGIGLYLFEKI
jgi:mannosyltransferase